MHGPGDIESAGVCEHAWVAIVLFDPVSSGFGGGLKVGLRSDHRVVFANAEPPPRLGPHVRAHRNQDAKMKSKNATPHDVRARSRTLLAIVGMSVVWIMAVLTASAPKSNTTKPKITEFKAETRRSNKTSPPPTANCTASATPAPQTPAIVVDTVTDNTVPHDENPPQEHVGNSPTHPSTRDRFC